MLRKAMVGVAVCVVAMATAAGSALAGEITPTTDDEGNYRYTPVAEFRAGSICSFSGLNDDYYDPDAELYPSTDRVQTFGRELNNFAAQLQVKKSELAPVIRTEGPGTSCRGYASQGD